MKFLTYSLLLLTYLSASTLNLSMSSSPSRLNPILANDSASSEISDWLFNGLFKYDKNGNPTVELAKSYNFETPTKLAVPPAKAATEFAKPEVEDEAFSHRR